MIVVFGLPTVTAAIAVRELILSARRWLACHEKCLEGDEQPLKNVPKTEFKEILFKEVMEAAELLKDVGASVKKAYPAIESLENQIKDVLDKAAKKGSAKRVSASGLSTCSD